MRAIFLGPLLLLLIAGTSVCAFSWDDDSHYVSLGPRNGYHIVRPDSQLQRQLGLYEAPVIDTADWLRMAMGRMRSRSDLIGRAY